MIEWNPDDLDLPLRLTEPTEIAVTLFGDDDPFERTAAVFGVMGASPHRYTVTAKEPARALEWFAAHTHKGWDDACAVWDSAASYLESAVPALYETLNDRPYAWKTWPIPNVAINVTVSDQQSADKLLPMLAQIPAHRRIVRATLRGPVDLRAAMGHHSINGDVVTYGVGVGAQRWQPGIDQVIISAEDGPDATPVEIGWLTKLAGQVLDAQTMIIEENPDTMEGGGVCTGFTGPALSIEQWPVCPECAGNKAVGKAGAVVPCSCDDGQSREAMTERRPEDINPRIGIPGHGTKRYGQGIRWQDGR